MSECERGIAGGAIQITKGNSKPQKFLKKFQKELKNKKVALFVCCGSAEPIDDKADKAQSIADARRKYLEAVSKKIKPSGSFFALALSILL